MKRIIILLVIALTLLTSCVSEYEEPRDYDDVRQELDDKYKGSSYDPE